MASVAVKFKTRRLRGQTARWWPGGPVGLEIPVDSSGSVTLVPGLSLHVGLDGPWAGGGGGSVLACVGYLSSRISDIYPPTANNPLPAATMKTLSRFY